MKINKIGKDGTFHTSLTTPPQPPHPTHQHLHFVAGWVQPEASKPSFNTKPWASSFAHFLWSRTLENRGDPTRLLRPKTASNLRLVSEKTWRSEFPVSHGSTHLKQGKGVIVLEETSGGALHLHILLLRKRDHSVQKLFLVFFLKRTSAMSYSS